MADIITGFDTHGDRHHDRVTQAPAQTARYARNRNAPTRSRTRKSAARSGIKGVASKFTAIISGAGVIALITMGWWQRDENYLIAESGLGYALGIIGACMMLLLLAYPLRKRSRVLSALGSVASLFRIHMILGVAGPLFILFHANFKLGSLNSSAALISMLAVALSGLVGRYLYARLHMGLYGRKAELRAILADAHQLKLIFGENLAYAPEIHETLKRFEHRVLGKRNNLIADMAAALALRRRVRRCRNKILRQASTIMHDQAYATGLSWWQRRQQMAAVRQQVDAYIAAIRKAALLAVFERLFALWHLLHLPLFIILVVAAVVHVIAVHLY